ncbi:unnamed protein product, partial [Allacma fusca]
FHSPEVISELINEAVEMKDKFPTFF